jgi:hypothetical protein
MISVQHSVFQYQYSINRAKEGGKKEAKRRRGGGREQEEIGALK